MGKNAAGGCLPPLQMVIGLLVGGALLLAGLGCGLLVPILLYQESERIAALPLVPGVVLSDGRLGREVVVEGIISARTPTRYENLVAYTLEQEVTRTDSDGDTETSWETIETVTPPLLLETTNGRARLEASAERSSYSLYSPYTTVRPLDRDDQRYQGFATNAPVVAVGVIVEGSEGRVLDADFVAGGTREAYVESQRTGAIVFLVIGTILSGIGLIAIGASALRARR